MTITGYILCSMVTALWLSLCAWHIYQGIIGSRNTIDVAKIQKYLDDGGIL